MSTRVPLAIQTAHRAGPPNKRSRRIRSAIKALVAALLLISLLDACAPQTPSEGTPELGGTPGPHTPDPLSEASPGPVQVYTSESLGLELSYSVDWLLTETKTGLVVGTSEQVIGGGELASGAGVAVEVEPLPNAEWQSLEELCSSRASVFRSEEMEIGEPQLLSIGGEEAALVTVHGKPGLGDTPVRGFVALVAREGRAYYFVALSVAAEWTTYETALQTIIQHVRFLSTEEPEYTPDAWEPDDSLDKASLVATGSSHTHNLHRKGDRDYVCFEATRGHVYTVETANLGPDLDTRIFLHDCGGNLITQDDDGRALEEPRASRLTWTAERTCTHWVMVHDLGDDDSGPGTSYDLRIWEEVHFVEDEYEPDDSLRLATELDPGSPQPHNLHLAGDRDVMRFYALAGVSYLVETFALGADVDTILRLLDEEGNELAWNDNADEEEEPLASRLLWTATSDATIYVVVHDSGDDAEGPDTQYHVRLIQTPP